MTENFPNLKKETDIQVQKAQRVPNKMNPNRPTPRHLLIKLSRIKYKKNIKSSKRKTTNNILGNPHKVNS